MTLLIRECDYRTKNAGALITARSQEMLATAGVQFAVPSGMYSPIVTKELLA